VEHAADALDRKEEFQRRKSAAGLKRRRRSTAAGLAFFPILWDGFPASRADTFERRAAHGAECEIVFQTAHTARALPHLDLVGEDFNNDFGVGLRDVVELDGDVIVIAPLVFKLHRDRAADEEVAEFGARDEPAGIWAKPDAVFEETAFDLDQPFVGQQQVVEFLRAQGLSWLVSKLSVIDGEKQLFVRRKQPLEFFQLIIFYFYNRFHKTFRTYCQ
jgi:hypothetical protein